MMPSANLEKHHGFPPPPPGFLCLKCIKFWRLLRLLGPEHLIPGRGWCGEGVLHTTKGSLLSLEGRGGTSRLCHPDHKNVPGMAPAPHAPVLPVTLKWVPIQPQGVFLKGAPGASQR